MLATTDLADQIESIAFEMAGERMQFSQRDRPPSNDLNYFNGNRIGRNTEMRTHQQDRLGSKLTRNNFVGRPADRTEEDPSLKKLSEMSLNSPLARE